MTTAPQWTMLEDGPGGGTYTYTSSSFSHHGTERYNTVSILHCLQQTLQYHSHFRGSVSSVDLRHAYGAQKEIEGGCSRRRVGNEYIAFILCEYLE